MMILFSIAALIAALLLPAAPAVRPLLAALALVWCATGVQADALSPAERARADGIISSFENGTPVIQYDYAEDIHDGRGITAGRAGFTTATGDVLIVVERYGALKPEADIVRYLPRLRKLAAQQSAKTSGIKGFVAAWKQASKDAAFRQVQDAVVDEVYYLPAMKQADAAGLQTALGRFIIYDTIIQHGEGEDHDGLDAVMARADKKAGGSVASGVAEAVWLKSFLDVRRATLLHAADPSTREAWAESVTRVDVLRDLFEAKNFALAGPIKVGRGYETVVP